MPLHYLVAVLLVLMLYAQMMGSARVKSATYDEQTYYARGYAVLKTGDMRLRLRHPLLTNIISAAPLLLLPDLGLPTDHGSWINAEFHEFSAEFLWNTNADQADQVVYLSRWPMMLLTLALAAFVHRWARAMFGPRGALLALVLVAFDPNIVAHGRLANTDLGATLFIFVAAYAFWAYQRRPSWPRLLLAGVVCGLAQTTRFTAMLLFPIFGLEALAMVWARTGGVRLRGVGRAIVVVLVLAGVSLLTIWAVYGFTWGLVDGTALSLPAPDHWGELLSLVNRLDRADPAFLLGRVYEGGRWPYFFVTFAVKTPLPIIILIGWATVRMIRLAAGGHHCLLRDLALILPALAYFGSGVASSLNIGYRLILPIVPFLAVHSARLVADAPYVPRGALRTGLDYTRVVPTILVVGLAATTLSAYPHYLAYFNELVGRSNGYKVLVDSNLDWGQDLPGLKAWMDENDVEEVYLSWFGIAPPEHYGVRYRHLPGWPPFENRALRIYHPLRPLAGIYAISATHLQGVLLDDVDTYAAFRARSPIARIGYSIHIYEIPPSGPPADLALGSVRFDELPTELLDARYATNDLRLRWFDPQSSLILMLGRSSTCSYAAAVSSPTLDPLATRCLAGLGASQAGPKLLVYDCPGEGHVTAFVDTLAASPVLLSPHERSPVFPPVSFDRQVAYLGHELLTPSRGSVEEVSLLTYWRVLERPAQPLKIFVHLIDDQGQIWGQQDRLDVPVEGWYPDDVVVQHLSFTVAEGVPPGGYWIEIGLYSPETLERMHIVGGEGGVPAESDGDRLLVHEVVID
jgi:hypothetical protein